MRFSFGFWRKVRIAFRWLRYCVWLITVMALLALAWVNVVGVPNFVKTRIITSLDEHGVHLEFSRLRWRFIRGLIAENVIIGDKIHRAEKPLLTAGQIQLRLDYSAMAHGKFQLTGVVLRDGIFTLPLSATNRLVALNIQSEVRFLPENTWSLDELSADFSGAKFRLAGQVAHAPEALKWDLFSGKKSTGRDSLNYSLEDLSKTLRQIRFATPPQISADISGDARDIHSFTVRLMGNAPAVVTPWFSAQGLQLVAKFSAPSNAPVAVDDSLGLWTNALPFRLAWLTRASELQVTNFSARAAEIAGEWSDQRLAVSKITAQSGNGRVDAAAALDVVTRELQFTNRSAFDWHLLEPFLPEPARSELAQISWTQPPRLDCEGSLTLPAWTNATFDWRAMFGPTARLRGEFAATNATVRGLNVDVARTHFSYRDYIWRAPDLQIRQGRTQLEFSGEQSVASQNFSGRLRGTFALESARPILPADAARVVFKIVQLNEPVVFDVQTVGNWKNLNTFTATGHVAVTNFAVRSQTYDSVSANLYYTNLSLQFLHPLLIRANGAQSLTGDAVALDWGAHMIYFTNGFGTMDPRPLVRSIGGKAETTVAPYEYLAAPTARVHGQLPLRDFNSGRDLDGTDLTFEIIKGAPFRWTKLNSTYIYGTVRWMGRELLITNIMADAYGGKGGGWAYFDFRMEHYGCDFKFGLTTTNLDVRQLAYDLSDGKTNLVEGLLTCSATITDARSDTWRSWNGFGNAQLRDGMLWNVPVFGFLSPMLNTITPGLGNNRATDATTKFVMTNGVARSDLLEIRTLTMRLQYVGTVDLDQNVNARVTAQLLRNAPVIGSVVSTVLWPVSKIFECQVDGKVSDPKVTPIYIPGAKYLLSPLRTLEEILPLGEKPKG